MNDNFANNLYICVFCYPEGFDPAEYARFYSKLRCEKMKRLKRESSVRQSAAAELAFRAAVKAATTAGLPVAEDETYTYLKNGSPHMEKGFLSLSHTDGAAAAAFSLSPVGIDIERIRRVDQRIANRVMNEAEFREYLKANDRAERLLTVWTAKESCAKLTGDGLSALSDISTDPEHGKAARGDSVFCIEHRNVPLLSPQGRAKLALCAFEKPEPHILIFHEPEELVSYLENS